MKKRMSPLGGNMASFGFSELVSAEGAIELIIEPTSSIVTVQGGTADGSYRLEATADPEDVVDAGDAYWYDLLGDDVSESRQVLIRAPITAVRLTRLTGTVRFSVLGRG